MLSEPTLQQFQALLRVPEWLLRRSQNRIEGFSVAVSICLVLSPSRLD